MIPAHRKRMAAVAVAAALVLTGVGLGAAHAVNAGGTSGDPKPDVAAPAPAPPAVPAVGPTLVPVPQQEPSEISVTIGPTVNGSSADIGGVPYYDVNSDPSLIQYPVDFSADELAHAQLWVGMMAMSAECMHSKGFPFRYILWWDRPSNPSPDLAARLNEPFVKHGTPAFEALHGDPYAPDYDPQVGEGCDAVVRAHFWDNPLIHAN